MKTRVQLSQPRKTLPAMLVLALALPAQAQEARKSAPLAAPPRRTSSVDVPKIRYTDFTLPNGLRVILHEDHSSPLVAVEMWYHVGSKNDTPGRTGLAHMLEHMFDKGTANLAPAEYRRMIQQAGGQTNAFTSTDWTRYATTIPSNNLETMLWLDAELMANLPYGLDSTRFDLEREAVRNEYRERVLNSAQGSGAEAMYEAMFEKGAYRLPNIGYMSELGATTVEDLRSFYRTYYVPNNAVLVVAGDFTSADARKQVEKYFGAIPRGKPVVQPSAVGPLEGEKRLVVEHASGVRHLWIGWRGAKAASPDRVAAMALSSILSDRLRRVLVDGRRGASSVPAAANANFDLEESAIFQTTVIVNGPATEVERLVDSVVTSIRNEGVTESEVRRWVAGFRTRSLAAMQSVSAKALYLGDATTTQRNPLGIFGTVESAVALTPKEVQAAARKYLTSDRVVLNIVPTGKLDLISKPELPYVNASRKP